MMTISSSVLTFQELRDRCKRHLEEKMSMYSLTGNRKLRNPHPDFLNEEFSEVRQRLVSNQIAYDTVDLKNSFFSVVYELEYNTVIYPNSVVMIDSDLCRVISFRHKYPVEIEFKVFTKGGNGRLKKGDYSTSLKEPLRLIWLIDPLVK